MNLKKKNWIQCSATPFILLFFPLVFYGVKTDSFSGQQSHQAGSWPGIASIPLYLWTIINLVKESFFLVLESLPLLLCLCLWYFLFQKVHGVLTTFLPPSWTTYFWSCSHFWLGDLPFLLCIRLFQRLTNFTKECRVSFSKTQCLLILIVD